jgi:hypothetical protein
MSEKNKDKKDVMDYNDPSKRKWRNDSTGKPVKSKKTTGSVKGYLYEPNSSYGTRAELDENGKYAGLTGRAGRGDSAKDQYGPRGQDYLSRKSGYQADAAYQQSWINKGKKASDDMRAKATALSMMKKKSK